MKIFKSAFTLAEAMIAMGIIGIVAAVTIPQVVQNTLKNQAGAILGRTVEQIELGCQNIIQKANDNITVEDGGYYEGLEGITQKAIFGDSVSTNHPLDGEELFNYGGAFFGTNEFQGDENFSNADAYITSIKNFNGGGNRISAGKRAYILDKQKTIIIPNAGSKDAALVDDFITAVFIDVNGTKKPNRGGKDVFLFALTTAGKLIPAGTSNYQRGFGIPLHTKDCKDGAVGGGWSCTARVVKDGYKITYY